MCLSQFDLVCSDAWLVDMYQATLNIGFLVGSIAIGYLADRYVSQMCSESSRFNFDGMEEEEKEYLWLYL